MNDFWQMGGYGTFVWSAYGIVIVVLVANVIAPYWRQRRRKRQLRSEFAE